MAKFKVVSHNIYEYVILNWMMHSPYIANGHLSFFNMSFDDQLNTW
mgnify:FL=1